MLGGGPTKKCTEEDIEALFGKGPKIPEAVFFCSIEPPSLSKQAALEHALSLLQREDPSLRVTYDTEAGQIILGGMLKAFVCIQGVSARFMKKYTSKILKIWQYIACLLLK